MATSSLIGKALGLPVKPPSASDSLRKGSGSTTNQGWFHLFRSRGLQAYVKSYPDLAASLKHKAVPSTDYPSYIPAEDLKHIDAGAQLKADVRCPVASAAS